MPHPLFNCCGSLLKYDVIVLASFFCCVFDKLSFGFVCLGLSIGVRRASMESTLEELVGLLLAIAFRSAVFSCKFASEELELIVRLFLKTLQKHEIGKYVCS